ncbi:hypothetical protein AURDEDRAFT_111106 [Auricularia subglabra TFB-10046 SS5]|nr:hypothetical protein AURDEDRAFT_111106 [Auricularia subglabra TFB-10046 SS5]
MSEQFHNEPVDGFWKMSWQPVSSRPTELELLSDLHKNGWLPGLVRPYDFRPSTPDETQGNSPAGQTEDDAALDQAQAATVPDTMQIDTVREEPQTDTASVQTQVEATKETRATDAALVQRIERAIHHPANLGDVGRVKEVLHLGSVGQPLSQCETTGHLIKVLYDLVETHAHMCERKVLHRDVSWFNVMCKARHLIKKHPLTGEDTVLARPCIDGILGHPDPEPHVLLADLDHSIKLRSGTMPQLAEKTGTPMFIAMEMSKPEGMRFADQPLDRVRYSLAQAENYTEHFARAFPNGPGSFMANFDLVVAAEKARIAKKPNVYGAPPPPKTRHDWRHDAESIYWVFLWAFARARPLGSSPDDDFTDDLNSFCLAMFSHSIGGKTGEAQRGNYLTKLNACNSLFHPGLKELESLFNRIAMYLSIPWYLYCGDEAPTPLVERDHAHVAIRRIVLDFVLDPENANALVIALDTEVPRYTSALEGFTRETVMTTTKRALTSATGGSKRTGAGSHESTSSLKRKAAVVVQPPRKRKSSQLATEGDDVVDGNEKDETDGEEAATSNPPTGADAPPEDECTPEDESTDDCVMQYVAKEHQFATTPDALRLMFWKDRALWFSAGINPSKGPKTSSAA